MIDDQTEDRTADVVRTQGVTDQFERVHILGKSDLVAESPEKQPMVGQQLMNMDPEFQMIGSASQLANPFISLLE